MRARPNQALSRLHVPEGRVEAQAECAGIGAGSGKSRTSREHSSARSRKSCSWFRGSPVHHKRCGKLASSNERTAPGSRSTAFGPALSTIRSEQTCGRPGDGRWQSAEISAVILRSGSSEPHSKIGRHGNRAMTVSRTGASDSTSPLEALDDEVGEHDAGDVGVFELRATDLLGRGPPQPGQLGLDVAKLDRDSLTFDERSGGRRRSGILKSELGIEPRSFEQTMPAITIDLVS